MISEENRKKIDSIERIVRRAASSKRFALVFAICSSPAEQARLIKALIQKIAKGETSIADIQLMNKMPINNLRPVIDEYLLCHLKVLHHLNC